MSLFSAPKFLAMPAIGLDISMDAIRFIELAHKGDKLVVSRFAGRQFPMGTVAEGRSADKKKLQDVIGALAHEFKLGFANVSLPEEQAYLANMQVPRVSAGELRDAIELHLEEYVPISGPDAIFDYVIVGDGGRRKDTIDVVVSAMPRAIIDEYLEIFHGTGVTPKAFELESQAMARSIIPRGDNGTFLVVDIGKMVTDIFVAAHGVVQFSASLDVGGHNFTQAIAKALGVTYEEAEALKAKHGLVGGGKDADLRAVLAPAVSEFRTRIMQHYMYWQTHHGEKIGGNIEAVYLTGGGANLKGIAEFLAMGVDVQVKIANPWVNVCSFEEYIPPLPMRQSHGFSAAIGLALRDSFSA